MKKILSLVLAMVMIMAMAVPAFAAVSGENAPCAAGCNGNHVYEQASTKVTYTHTETSHTKTVITYYKCIYCASTTETTQKTTSGHDWEYAYVVDNVSYFQCTECGRYKTVD